MSNNPLARWSLAIWVVSFASALTCYGQTPGTVPPSAEAPPSVNNSPAEGTAGSDTSDVVMANNAFALDLYSRLANQPGNLFFSPYSIESALAMTSAGAMGQTAEQMSQFCIARRGSRPWRIRRFDAKLKRRPAFHGRITSRRYEGGGSLPAICGQFCGASRVTHSGTTFENRA